MNRWIASIVAAVLAASAEAATVGESTRVCAVAGPPDVRAPGQEKLDFYGTDLGYNYVHDGKLEILFGDTWANPHAGPIGAVYPPEVEDATTAVDLAPLLDGLPPSPEKDGFMHLRQPLNVATAMVSFFAFPGRNDDSFASVDLEEYPDGDFVEGECAAGAGPLVFGTNEAGRTAGLDPGTPLELLKTPLAGFSNGTQEFAIFINAKPIGCRSDDDCSEGYECDRGLGYVGTYPEDVSGLTLPCVDGSATTCHDDTIVDPVFPLLQDIPALSSYLLGPTLPIPAGVPVPGTGLCVDPTSSVATTDAAGRVSSVVVRHKVGLRKANRREYAAPTEWITNRFLNLAATVDPSGEKVFLWGRPHFASLNAEGRSLHLYFATVDMPRADSSGSFAWSPQYFAGLDEAEEPIFSANPRNAVPLDLSGGAGDPHESHDVVNQLSVRWIEPLGKWVMFDGGGAATPGNNLSCSIVACNPLAIGNGAIRMRTADQPWGPWSPAQDVLVAGNPARPKEQYGPGGVLRHPDCQEPSCAPHSPGISFAPHEKGFLYAGTIIEPWTEAREGGAVDLFWLVSTWDPYSVWLMKTRIDP